MKRELRFSWKGVGSEEIFFQKMLPLLQAPDWHGHNLSALSDSVCVGQVNGVEPPYCLVMEDVEKIPEQLVPFAKRVIEIWFEAARGRSGVEVCFASSRV